MPGKVNPTQSEAMTNVVRSGVRQRRRGERRRRLASDCVGIDLAGHDRAARLVSPDGDLAQPRARALDSQRTSFAIL